MKLRCCLVAVVAAALNAVATPAMADNKPLLDARDLQRLNRVLQTAGGVGQALRQESMKSPLQRQRWGYGVVGQPRLDAVMGEIIEELRRASGRDVPAARVYVTPDPSFQAYATEDGSIFVSVGMLQNLESRDELAALLGHEYAHVLRGHSARTALESSRSVLAGLSSMYMDNEFGDRAAAASRPETRYVRQALLRETAMQSVQAGIVPARARGQEDEADRIGTDLMVAAGYNPVGMVDLLDRLDQWEAMRREATAAQPQQQGAFAGVMTRYARRTEQARAAGRKVDDRELVGGVIDALAGSVGDGVRNASRGHRAAGERGEKVLAHIQRRHSDERPDMRPLPWQEDQQVQALFASLDQMHRLLGGNDPRLARPGPEQAAMLQALRNGPAAGTPLGRYVELRFLEPGLDRSDAIAGLRRELAQPDSLFAAHQLVLELASRSGDREQAVVMLDESRKSLGDPPELLPYGVRMHRRAGHGDTARLYAARCAGSGDEYLRQACQKEL